jgi:hypothetical protein
MNAPSARLTPAGFSILDEWPMLVCAVAVFLKAQRSAIDLYAGHASYLIGLYLNF